MAKAIATYRSHFSAGVTLVELVIIISIIGLIIGMVASGVHIKRAIDNRKIISDIQEFQVAIDQFKFKYQMLPGDFSGATLVWQGEQNGNNDRRINHVEEGDSESYHLWRHLSAAGLLKRGSFTGKGGQMNNEAVINENIPVSFQSKVGYFAYFTEIHNTVANVILLGAYKEGDINRNSALLPVNARGIDLKLDDGFANTGNIIADEGADMSPSRCSKSSGRYQLSLDKPACAMYFKIK